jgi:hypothetical protein
VASKIYYGYLVVGDDEELVLDCVHLASRAGSPVSANQ